MANGPFMWRARGERTGEMANGVATATASSTRASPRWRRVRRGGHRAGAAHPAAHLALAVRRRPRPARRYAPGGRRGRRPGRPGCLDRPGPGLALAAKVGAIDDAQAAARAGAQAIDIPLYRATGQMTLDPQAADADAERYLASTGRTGTVTVAGDQVTVTVSVTQPTQILSIVGIDSIGVSGTGSATAEQAP